MESLLILLISISISISISSISAFTPPTTHFLNCGSNATITFPNDNPPRNFTPDSQIPSISTTQTLTINPTTLSSTSPSLYTTARLFIQPFTYTFTVNSTGTHVLRLHFSPFTTPAHNLSSANFNVSALQTFLLLASFSPSTTTTIKEYFLWLDSDEFQLTFTPNSSPSLAFISAIELFTAPPFLIDNTTEPKQVSRLGNDSNIDHIAHQALETVYRINVGGPKITPENDTLWRTWTPDDDFLFSNATTVEAKTTTDKISYYAYDKPRSTPEIAPKVVYSTAREMNISDVTQMANPNFNFNMTWNFPVPSGYKYFIRMHFCDFVSEQPLSLIFNIYIGDLSASQYFILGWLTYQTLSQAHYVDFIAADDVRTSGSLKVSVGPSDQSNSANVISSIMNGLEIMKINNTVGSLNGTFNSIVGTSVKKHRHVSLPVTIVSAAAAPLVLIFIAVITFVLIHKTSKPALAPSSKANTTTQTSWSPYRHDSINNNSSSGATTKMKMELELYIPLSDIKLATNDFDEKLIIGRGGFGNVYKGVLKDGTKVAVKRAIRKATQGFTEFVNEISVLSKIRHKHLVSLVGYCHEMGEMILVYEFMEMGTLKSCLYGSQDTPCLSWKQRLAVCIGVARGLDYLHTAHSPVIIHRDMKSTNILLGDKFLAKISDFGISKLGPLLGEETYVSTGVKGSFGYFDPEYFRMLRLTTKSDVYSFGVVLFEVLCARPVIDPRFKNDELNLADWALQCLKKGQLEKIIDQRIAGEINPKSLEKFCETAERCLAKYGDDRPTIGDVLWNLEYILQLQETELLREPHDDSGTVDTQLQSLRLVRRMSSLGTTVDEDLVFEESVVQLEVDPCKIGS